MKTLTKMLSLSVVFSIFHLFTAGQADITQAFVLPDKVKKYRPETPAVLLKNLEKLDLSLSPKNQAKVLKRIVKLGDSKQNITHDDLPFIIADVMESSDYHHIKLLNCSITSGLNLESTVSIAVQLHGKTHKSTGSGNGGFDAFINAIGKVFEADQYVLPKLEDFEVRIPRGGNTNALTECIITWQSNEKSIKTRGVHSNQVFAAILATTRVINLQLHELSISSS